MPVKKEDGQATNALNRVKRYYSTAESKIGYRLILKGVKHYGYYPSRNNNLSMAESQRLMEQKLGNMLDLPRGSKVLDAGCGEGAVAIHLSDEFGFQIDGIDILDLDIRHAIGASRAYGPRAPKFRVMDYSHTDYPDNFFDGVYTMESFVHSPNYRSTLREFYRVLKPGGRLVNFEYSLADKMTSDEEKIFGLINNNSAMTSLGSFRHSKLKSIWEKAGFEHFRMLNVIENISPVMRRMYRISFVPYQISRILGRKEKYVNTYAMIHTYRLRNLIHYNLISSLKPSAGSRNKKK